MCFSLTAVQQILPEIHKLLSVWLSQFAANLNFATFNHVMTDTCACFCLDPWLTQKCPMRLQHPGSWLLWVVAVLFDGTILLSILLVQKAVAFVMSLIPESVDIEDLAD